MSRVPRIRFKGFEEDWEQRKTSELFKITRGYVLAANITDGNKSGDNPYPVYSSQTKDNGLMGYYKDYLYENAITWTTDGANAGTVNYRDEKFYCTNVCGVLLGDKVTPNQMLAEAINNVAKSYVSYVGNPKLMNNVMAEICIWLPSEDTERKAISSFVYSLDYLITLHQRKLEKFKIIKKSMLENLFPQNGEKTPKIRFSGFTEDWEQRKLGEMVEFYNGDRSSRYPNDSDMVFDGIPFINAGDLVLGRVKLDTTNKITEEKYNQLSGAKIQCGDIIYCLRGTLGKNAFVDNFDIGTIASSLVDIRPQKIVGKYLFQVLNSDIEYSQRILNDEGAAQPNLSAKNLYLFDIPIPRDAEQIKIAEYLELLDHLITLHQSKLDKLQKIKKSMLESMFV